MVSFVASSAFAMISAGILGVAAFGTLAIICKTW